MEENSRHVVHLYDVFFNDGRVFYWTDNNEKASYGNQIYIPIPIKRSAINQNKGLSINTFSIVLGDVDLKLSKPIIQNIDLIRNATVVVRQQLEDVDSGIMSNFLQIFIGKIKTISSNNGIMIFNIVEPYSDWRRPLNNKKWGEVPGVVAIHERLSA